MLVDLKTASSRQLQRVAEVVIHELAHQWFGNLVTMEWWEDLWLNEGFATWMETGARLRGALPEWSMWEQFITDMQGRALQLDALRSSHPIQVPIKNAEEVEQVFDAISYCKGGSVVRMVHAVVGETDFVGGLRASASLVLSQRRFFADGAADDAAATWTVPLFAATAASGETSLGLMPGKAATVAFGGAAGAPYVKLNAGQHAPLRCKYPDAMMPAFAEAIRRRELPPADRIGLLSDAAALSRAGDLDFALYLEILFAFEGEDDATVWSQVLAQLLGLIKTLRGADDRCAGLYAAFKKLASAALIAPTVASVGWDPKDEDAHLTKKLRGEVISALPSFCDDDAAVLAEATRRFDLFKAGDKDALPAEYQSAAYKLVLAADAGRYAEVKAHDSLRLNEAQAKIGDSGSSLMDAVVTGACSGYSSEAAPPIIVAAMGRAMRTFVVALAAPGAGASLLPGGSTSRAAAPAPDEFSSTSADAPRPNMLLTVVDDWGSGDVSYNDAALHTPELQRMSEHGFDSVIHSTEPRGVPLDERFLSQKLSDAGYRTAAIGKWHLGMHRDAYTPLKRGFDLFYGILTGGGSHTGHFSVSQPFTRDLDDERPTLCGMIAEIDDGLKTLRLSLENAQAWAQTIFVVLSDNGGVRAHGSANYPLRAEKAQYYEGGVKVPAVLAGGYVEEALRRAGGAERLRSASLAHITDVHATFLSLAGYEGGDDDKPLDGVSLFSHLVQSASGVAGAAPRSDVLININSALFAGSGAIRVGDHKLMAHYFGLLAMEKDGDAAEAAAADDAKDFAALRATEARFADAAVAAPRQLACPADEPARTLQRIGIFDSSVGLETRIEPARAAAATRRPCAARRSRRRVLISDAMDAAAAARQAAAAPDIQMALSWPVPVCF
ncbi:metalloaminopeptidase [Aureococcus anophagefferens]|nr:metalloaminopeptidase [Aureococcus anophagefferens]